jgi:hypothetical protein
MTRLERLLVAQLKSKSAACCRMGVRWRWASALEIHSLDPMPTVGRRHTSVGSTALPMLHRPTGS